MPNTKNIVYFAVGALFAMFVWPWIQTRLASLRS